jgi:hypothetical protein|tara:strand:+ start:1352 stop:1651 length:300 start_codon:yes stop_codon:yes gene_type:complete
MTWALPTNVTTIGDYGTYVVSIDPNFFSIMLFGIWLILFISLRASPNLSTPISWTTASFGALLASLLLSFAGYVGIYTPVMYLVGLITGILLLVREGGM